MQRLFLLLWMLVCLWGALPVGAEDKSDKITIRFWHAMRGNRHVLLERFARRFEATHPDVKIETRAVLDQSQRLGNDYSALYRALLESLAQGSPPEVAQLYENWVTQLVEVNALYALDTDLAGVIDDLCPAFKRVARAADGKVYSIPYNKSLWVLFYNREMLKQAGVEPPRTWDDLRKASLAITKATGKPGLVFRPGVDVFSLHFLANGGSYLDSQGKPVFATPQAAQSLSYWVDFVHQDHSSLPTLRALEIFAQGNAGMLLDTTSKLSRLESENNLPLGMAATPIGSREAPLMAGTNLGVFRSKDARRQKLAIEFTQFLTSSELLLPWCELTGHLPVRNQMLSSPDYKSFLQAHPYHSVGVDALAKLVSLPEVAGWESVRGLLDDAFYAALSRQATAQQALSQAAAQAQELLGQLRGSPNP